MRQRILVVAIAAITVVACSSGTPSSVPASSSPSVATASPAAPPTRSAEASPSALAVVPVCAAPDQTPLPASTGHPGDGVPDPEGRIVFGRIVREDRVKGQIVSLHAVDPDGSDVAPLLGCETARPRFSPDGSRLAFAIVMSDQSFQVATMDAGGGDLRILTDTPGYAETPDWAPDGSWLIYSYAPKACVDFEDCVVNDGNLWTLWRMNADGSDQRLIGNPDTFDWEPRVSPDGREVVFTRFDPANGWSMTLMIRDLVTGDERVVTTDERHLEHPDWSPDGRWIVYNGTDCRDCAQIERVPVDDPSATPEVLYPADATHGGAKPVYSPDGSSIAFGCLPGLCRMNADGSNVVVVNEPQAGVEVNHFDWSAGQP
jgi:Tol biopolymer transport system component